MDGYDLSRFVSAQKQDFEKALSEIRAGRKRSHWMWYVFPQLKGLGRSGMSEYYGIEGLGEARAYLANGSLASNLRSVCEALLENGGSDAEEILGRPDDMKLRSSMTLFLIASGGDPLFRRVLERFFGGETDPLTLRILDKDR